MDIKYTLDNGAYRPEKAHDNDAGFDLRTKVDFKPYRMYDGDSLVIDTGVHVAIPSGYVGYVQGRSGLNIVNSIICPTGVCDCGYTGSIKVKLYAMTDANHEIKAGDKIAQLVIQPLAPVSNADFELVESLEDSERGTSGFGSTGR